MDVERIKRLFPRIILFEVIALSLVYMGVGYLFSPDDPLFLNTPFSPALIVSLVLSLYYGFKGGLPFLGIISLLSLFLYKDFPLHPMMWNLLVVFIASEFRYYWARSVRSAEFEKEYLEEQLSRLRREFFMLKLSHDQLEFNYIIKPYSIRRIIADLRDKLVRERNERLIMQYLLNILFQNFHIYKASVHRYSGKSFTLLADIGGSGEVKEDDPLVNMALESEESYYVPPKALSHVQTNGTGSKYLAAVFASSEGEKVLLVIEDMLFVNLNEEVLAQIYILLQYILDDIVFARSISVYYRDRERKCSFEFVREFYKMNELRKRVGVQSTVVVFRFSHIDEHAKQDLERAGRALDMTCILEEKGIVVFLLPFTAPVNTKSFIERVVRRYRHFELVSVEEVRDYFLEEMLGRVPV